MRRIYIVILLLFSIPIVYLLAVAARLFSLWPLDGGSMHIINLYHAVLNPGEYIPIWLVEGYWKFVCNFSEKCHYDGYPGNYRFSVRIQ